MILGFDLSLSHSACCNFETPENFSFDDLEIKSKETKQYEIDIEKDIVRYLKIGHWVFDLIEKTVNLDQVGIEGLAFQAKGNAVTKLAGLQAVTLGLIYERKNKMIPLIIYPTEARKAYFGTIKDKDIGNLSRKEFVFKSLSIRHPQSILNDHQADAYLIAYFIWKLKQKEIETIR